MVSSFAIAHRNRRTIEEMLRIHPDEGPVSIQLFGADPDVMREAAAVAAAAGRGLIDLNFGCPVPKVLKTGAGAALLDEPERAVAVARAAAEGSGLPVTVKLRSGMRRRRALRASTSPRGWSPRRAWRRSRCTRAPPTAPLAAGPTTRSSRELVEGLERCGRPVPVIVSGGLRTRGRAPARAYERVRAPTR